MSQFDNGALDDSSIWIKKIYIPGANNQNSDRRGEVGKYTALFLQLPKRSYE